ncbi:hypothetical protein LTR15_003832 [Elasticomyces elasticus]|nr:hypothetical protein LTR15_003832 [Elasticomyces elasticus]
MAAFNPHNSTHTTSHDYGSGSVEQQLPTGSCGFRDLSAGVEGPVCGCRRFWLSGSGYNGRNGSAQMAWCFCGHHACFHDAFSQQRATGQVSAAFTADAPLGKVHSSGRSTQNLQPSPPKLAASGLGIQSASLAPSQSINTRLWAAMNAFARNQEDGPASGITSHIPSTACPSVIEDEQPQACPPRSSTVPVQSVHCMGPPISIPYGAYSAVSADEYSATEVATPSLRGTPDLRAVSAFGLHPGTAPSGSVMARTSPMAKPSIEKNNAAAATLFVRAGTPQETNKTMVEDPIFTDEMRHLLRSLSHRVECLESMSFSHVPVEVVEEKFENMDVRLLDLEQWRTYTDNPAPTSVRKDTERRRMLPSEIESFSSDGSFDSTAAAHTEAVVLATLAANSETRPRIDDLERRLTDLEQAIPSFANPWHVQVVVLPFGRLLRGIWFSALEATQHSMQQSIQASDEWPGTQSAPKLSFGASTSAAWTTDSIEAWASDAHGWLSPKACGPNGSVFQRLASRGLVQDITLTAPDSRHILGALAAAFGPILDKDDATAPVDGHYKALDESFIPLRKERKSSRLRFLSKAEMVTPALWAAGFLDSAVIMKINDGHRRLYITTPEAYIQSDINGWSWEKLKQLPLFDASDDERAANARGSAIEACWAHNETLDRPAASLAPSFAISREHYGSPADQPMQSNSEITEGAQDTSRPYVFSNEQQSGGRHRTVSLPSSASAAEPHRVSIPKRRVASFETIDSAVRHSSDVQDYAVVKKRRISFSPEAERQGVGITPRMSREPPSPYTSELVGEIIDHCVTSRNRGTTPFAYATPHSNSNPGVDRTEYSAGDGDTEADTDLAMPHTEDDEWQSVEDDIDSALADRSSAMDEPEIEEGDLHEAVSSYAV